MDNKIKLFAVASVVAVMVSGCTGYNNQDTTGSSGYAGSQNTGSGQVANKNNAKTCTPCDAKTNNTYTYKPRTVTNNTKPKPKATGQHNQQYYIDRWNRQQNQARTNTDNGYYAANTASSTTYYDYSSAGRQTNNTGNLSTSNKSIYTGSYQKRTYKPYKPTTYAAGNNSSTYKAASNNSNRSASNSNTYIVKKGDTVFEIMRQTGVYWKDIIRINNLTAPYNINPGQVIRLK